MALLLLLDAGDLAELHFEHCIILVSYSALWLQVPCVAFRRIICSPSSRQHAPLLVDALCEQGRADRAASTGKSAVPGVYYHKGKGNWQVHTLRWRGGEARYVAAARTREGAEAIAAACLPRLEAAADEGRLEIELATAREDWVCCGLIA